VPARPAQPAQPAASAGRRALPWVVLAIGCTLAAVLAMWWMMPASKPGETGGASASASLDARAPASYLDNQLCLSCHQEQGRHWQQSHHAKAMAAATAESVRGDFNDAEFKYQGVTSRFFKRGDKYFVRTDGPDGKLADFEVSYTFGVDPLQQYLIAMPGGRLQPLQIAWDAPRKRWFHLLPHEKAPAGDVLHWTGRYQTANTMCIACHTTGFEKRFDAVTGTYASTWKEPNVSCQSCHGPGERHAQWARLKADGKPAPTLPGERLGLVVDLKAIGAAGQAEVCAACHSRRSELTAAPVPGQPRLDNYLPSLLQPRLYHPDGQQLDEVFVDGSFRQSKMFGKGVTCTDCHDAHTGKLKLAGNAVCTQCHAPQANPKFAGAAGRFDTPEHHFHKEGSAGAQCAACHMPSKNYMQIQARPDHSLRVPRPDLSVALGTPNACTQCHADKPAQWAADQVVAWYGARRRHEPHYGEAFAAARAGQGRVNESLAQLAADLGRPAIVRATALDGLRGDPRTGDSTRIDATRDADPEVRAAAADSLEALSPEQRLYGLTPLLRDPVRAVRIAAARSLSSLPADRIDAAARPAFDAALAEYVAAQSVSLDMPGAQLNLAVVYQNIGRVDLAERHYLSALRIDPDFTPARANLAQLYNLSARNADAERVLTEGLKRLPDLGELQYSLGLLLAEEQRLPEAARALAQAARLLPDRARVHYNLGLALQRLGQRKPAEAALLQAQRLDPLSAESAHALAVFYAQGGQRAQALEWAEKLQTLSPADPQVRQLVQRLRGKE
jgi:predicted CXXCH cytochrome family protein